MTWRKREGYLDDCTTDASRPGVEDEQGGIRKEGRKEGREDGLMQVGINAWLGALICTSAHANVSTGGDDAWVAAQADASAYMQCTWNLE